MRSLLFYQIFKSKADNDLLYTYSKKFQITRMNNKKNGQKNKENQYSIFLISDINKINYYLLVQVPVALLT